MKRNAKARRLSLLSLNKKMNPDYLAMVERETVSRAKINLNKLSSKEKISVALRWIDFLINYWTEPQQVLLPNKSLNKEEMKFWEGLKLAQHRDTFNEVIQILLELPDLVLSNIEELLEPNKKFTRKTFEYFAGLMKITPRTLENFYMIPNVKNYNEVIHNKFKSEYLEQEKIIEAALETTIMPATSDIKAFFQFIYEKFDDLNSRQEMPIREMFVERFYLTGIYVVTRRIIDTHVLHELSLLTSPLDDNDSMKKIKIPTSSAPIDIRKDKPPVDLKTLLSLSSLKHKFAVLATLQRIGELFTGKHLQTKVSTLDKTIDIQWFITIRDTLSHQGICDKDGYYDNYHKVQNFLNDHELFACVEMTLFELQRSVFNIIALRYSETKAFINKCDQVEEVYINFWKALLAEETASDDDSVHKLPEVIDLTHFMTEGYQEQFKRALKPTLTQEELAYVEAVLDGTEVLRGKKIKGEFIAKYLTNEKQSAARKTAIALLDEIDKARDEHSKRLRESKEQHNREKKAQRHQEQLSNDGLRPIIELVSLFRMPTLSKTVDTPAFTITASIEFLQHLQTFILEVSTDLTLDTFKKVQMRMCEDREFKFAFDYCAAQALTMINASYEADPIVQRCNYFKKHVDIPRKLRNWIQHGNAMLDFFEEDFQSPTPSNATLILNPYRNNVVYGILGQMILELLPDFRKIALIRLQTTPVQQAKDEQPLPSALKVSDAACTFFDADSDTSLSRALSSSTMPAPSSELLAHHEAQYVRARYPSIDDLKDKNGDKIATLSFSQGDTLKVLRQADSRLLLFCKCRGQRGFVPANYVEPITTSTRKSHSKP